MKKEQVFTCACMKCGWRTKSSEHCRTLACEKCGGMMRRVERPGPGQESVNINGRQFFEPGIEKPKTGNWIRVRQKSPGVCTKQYGVLVLSAQKGVQAVRCVAKATGKWITQSLQFDKSKWTASTIRPWIKDHGYVITAENFEKLQTVPVILRRIFNYRLDLIQEWREYYIEGLDKPDPRVWAWFRFESKYERSKQGRWCEKKE